MRSCLRHRKLYVIVTFGLAVAASTASGCSGTVIASPTCQSVCTDLLSCFLSNASDPSRYPCASTCAQQQQVCTSKSKASEFQALLGCVAAITCDSDGGIQSPLDPMDLTPGMSRIEEHPRPGSWRATISCLGAAPLRCSSSVRARPLTRRAADTTSCGSGDKHSTVRIRDDSGGERRMGVAPMNGSFPVISCVVAAA